MRGGRQQSWGHPLQDIIINTTGQGLNQLLVVVAVSEVSDLLSQHTVPVSSRSSCQTLQISSLKTNIHLLYQLHTADEIHDETDDAAGETTNVF